MINVILYTRVSTDEQADGMGREAQERYLRAYCTNHDYNIVGDEQPYKEDYSAKSHELDRPELMKVYNMLRNPFYAGIIRVPAYKDDPEQYVEGKHEALIDKPTFDKVQAVIDRKKKSVPKLAQKKVNPDLYLRKFLVCPVCGHPLTGATSTGNGGQYTYYFCNHDHKHLNKRAEEVNDGFVKYVSALKPNKAVLALYNEILLDIRGDKVRENKLQADKLEAELNSIQERADRVKDLFYDGQITKLEKEQAMARYNRQISDLKERICALRMSKDMKVQDKLDYSINIIGNLGEFFRTAKPEIKVLLLGSIFPQKIEFDGKNYRTKSYNRMLDVIYQETNKLQGKINKKSSDFSEDFSWVPGAGVENMDIVKCENKYLNLYHRRILLKYK